MLPIKDLQNKLDAAFNHAERNEVDQFINLHNEINQHLYQCLQLTVSTIPTLEKMANMKWAIVRANAFSTLLVFAGISLMAIGVTYIENTNISTLLTFILSIGAGFYLWDRVKMFSANFKSFSKINDHEKQMLDGLSYYISVGQMLKPFSIYAEMVIQDWKDKGLYTEEPDEENLTMEEQEQLMEELYNKLNKTTDKED